MLTKKYRRVFAIGVFYGFAFSMTGINVLVVFSKTIFKEGISDPDSKLPQNLSLILSLVNVCSKVGTIIGSKKLNRRKMTLWGLVGMVICCGAYAIIVSADSTE